MKTHLYILIIATISGLPLMAQNAPQPTPDLATTRAELIKAINEDRAAIQNANRSLEDFVGRITGELQALQQTIAIQQGKLNASNERIKVLETRNKALEEALSARIKALQDLIAEESKQRVAADQRVIGDVTAAVRDAAASTPPPPAKTTPSVSFRVLEVASGDTLSTIAKATNISVARLKAFNDLTSDTIFIGQKLKIPEQ